MKIFKVKGEWQDWIGSGGMDYNHESLTPAGFVNRCKGWEEIPGAIKVVAEGDETHHLDTWVPETAVYVSAFGHGGSVFVGSWADFQKEKKQSSDFFNVIRQFKSQEEAQRWCDRNIENIFA